MRYAIIENGLVSNVVMADAEFAAQNGWIACPDAGPNWKYDGISFTEPDPVVAPVVTAPTKEELMAELVALTAKIEALA